MRKPRRIRLSIAAGILLLLSGCADSPLLVVDPLLHQLDPSDSYPSADVAVVDGEFPWEQELDQVVREQNPVHVILTPLLEQAGRVAATDYPERRFYQLSLDSTGDSFPAADNLRVVPVLRDAAFHELGDAVHHYITVNSGHGSHDDTDDADQPVLATILLYTGNEVRRHEAEILLDRLTDLPEGSFRLRRYEVLPSRGGLQNEIVQASRHPEHVVVAMLSQRSVDAVQLAGEHAVGIVSEHLGDLESVPDHVLGSIDIDIRQAVEQTVRNLRRDSWQQLPQAILQLRESGL
ncbi:hypothetical protein [Spirochaeta africana]|uniref:TIR domain-containing protein n=1 Tax=Spirochaeta africana (strain ATCC 700263 / DSM 8902 / Z-7692) TaxID=889378 RepID=H9UHB7_SPIAZ|nr:hypothetical protein [Spirochaeta africana]AFG36910.1 hypothetical protein Spiaf_0816 [Spirochaeta africana DSM 8902]